MKKTIFAWVVFFGGLTIEMAIDYLLRKQDGDMSTGGIHEILWFLLICAQGAYAIWLIFWGTKPLVTMWKRLVIVGLQVTLGFILYEIMGLIYVIETGIDSL